MKAAGLCVLFALASCNDNATRHLGLDQVVVAPNAQLRTDTVGDDGQPPASFVIVDAKNVATDAAYVSLDGDLLDAHGAILGHLRAQSIWTPPGETRTFVLVDDQRQARAGAASAKIHVRGVLVPESPPSMHVEAIKVRDDFGKAVVTANLVNDVDRPGMIQLLAAFRDPTGRPMTRPFSMIPIGPKVTLPVQFVGPQGSTTGTIFIGDMTY